MRSSLAWIAAAHRFLARCTFYPLALSSALAVGIFAARVRLTGSADMVFLNWNLFLAWVPYVAALGVAALAGRRAWPAQLALGGLWLAFLPNGPYIVTDIIHLRTFTSFHWWYDLGLIVAYAWTGMFLSIASLELVHAVVRARFGALAGWGALLAAVGLSGLGVYLGRFLRWNSWDLLLAPGRVASDVLETLTAGGRQPAGVIAMYTAFLLVSYLMFHSARSQAGPGELAQPAAARSNPARAKSRSDGVLPSVITARTSE